MIIEAIIGWSVRHRWTIIAITGIVSIWGAWSFLSLPIDAVPDITNVQVQVNATSQGLSPEDVEAKVTYPLEIAMGGIPGVHEIRSLTKFGLSQVTIVFDDASDIFRNRQLVIEKLQSLSDLPFGVSRPTLSPITTGLGEIYHYTIQVPNVEGDSNQALMLAREIQEWIIKPRILTLPGVAEVNTIGGYVRQVQVHPDITKLASYRLGLEDIKQALQETNHNVGGSAIQEENRQLLVQSVGQFQSLEDVKKVPVKSLQNFRTITIGDVAKVEFSGGIRMGAALVNGREEVLGTVMMLSGANSRTVAKAVEDRIRALNSGNELPNNINIVSLYNRSDLVDATLRTVLHNLVVGAVLVIVVLFLLLGNIKAALAVSLSIPVTLLSTFGFMKIFGISGNLMSLGALDFGIIVDGAVIVVDHCVRRIQNRKKQESIINQITYASQEIRHAAGFGQIMVIVVFLPILGLGGIEGKMFRPMAETFSIALIIALLLSFTLIPALCAILFSEQESDSEPLLMRSCLEYYELILQFTLRRGKWVIGSAIVLILFGGFLFYRLGAEFLPRLDEGSLVLQILRPVNINLESSILEQMRSEKVIRSFGAVRGVFSRIGTAEVATDPMGQNESDTFILLKDKKDWMDEGVKFFTKEELIIALMKKIDVAVPGQGISATQPIQMRFNDLLEGTRADVTVKIYGDQLEELNRITHEMVEVIKNIPGAGDVLSEIRGEQQLLQIRPKLDVLSRYSLSARPVLNSISIGMAGEFAGVYYEDFRKIPLVIKLDNQIRNNLNAFRKLQVYVGENLTVPLEEVAAFENRHVFSPIYREWSKRRSAVLINPRGRDLQGFVKEAQTKVASSIKMSNDIRVEWFGSFKNLQDAKQRLYILIPIAFILVASMIYFAFRSIPETLIVLATVPIALVGGIFGLFVMKMPFSISAAIGFIALSGIAVLNGVVLMNYLNLFRHSVMESNQSWVIEGTKLRLRAVLMTALVDIFGFIPMAISTGVGAEIQKPLAFVVIGGVITSTLLTLVLLPVASSMLLNKADR